MPERTTIFPKPGLARAMRPLRPADCDSEWRGISGSRCSCVPTKKAGARPTLFAATAGTQTSAAACRLPATRLQTTRRSRGAPARFSTDAYMSNLVSRGRAPSWNVIAHLSSQTLQAAAKAVPRLRHHSCRLPFVGRDAPAPHPPPEFPPKAAKVEAAE